MIKLLYAVYILFPAFKCNNLTFNFRISVPLSIRNAFLIPSAAQNLLFFIVLKFLFFNKTSRNVHLFSSRPIICPCLHNSTTELCISQPKETCVKICVNMVSFTSSCACLKNSHSFSRTCVWNQAYHKLRNKVLKIVVLSLDFTTNRHFKKHLWRRKVICPPLILKGKKKASTTTVRSLYLK